MEITMTYKTARTPERLRGPQLVIEHPAVPTGLGSVFLCWGRKHRSFFLTLLRHPFLEDEMADAEHFAVGFGFQHPAKSAGLKMG